MRKIVRGADLLDQQYPWQKRGPNCFLCIGQAEVSRPKRGQPWVAMVPLTMDGTVPGAWGLLPDGTGNGIRQFPSAEDAMTEAEQYLSIFRQYHQPHTETALDLATGANAISGSQAIGG